MKKYIAFKRNGKTFSLNSGANWGFYIQKDHKMDGFQLQDDQMIELMKFYLEKSGIQEKHIQTMIHLNDLIEVVNDFYNDFESGDFLSAESILKLKITAQNIEANLKFNLKNDE
jgi:hypothetical protein